MSINYFSTNRQILLLTWNALNETANFSRNVYPQFKKLKNNTQFQTLYPDAFAMIESLYLQLHQFNYYMEEQGIIVKLGKRFLNFKPLYGGKNVIKKTTKASINVYHWAQAYSDTVEIYNTALLSDQHYINDLPEAMTRIKNILTTVGSFLDYMKSKGIIVDHR